jgi:hypothetical protein
MARIVNSHALFRAVLAWAGKDINLIVGGWVLCLKASGNHGKPSVNTLAATAAMLLRFGLEHHVDAGAGVPNQMLRAIRP